MESKVIEAEIYLIECGYVDRLCKDKIGRLCTSENLRDYINHENDGEPPVDLISIGNEEIYKDKIYRCLLNMEIDLSRSVVIGCSSAISIGYALEYAGNVANLRHCGCFSLFPEKITLYEADDIKIITMTYDTESG